MGKCVLQEYTWKCRKKMAEARQLNDYRVGRSWEAKGWATCLLESPALYLLLLDSHMAISEDMFNVNVCILKAKHQQG